MNILLIGSGGREQALAWKIAQSSHVSQLYITAATKNPLLDNAIPVAISIQDNPALVAFAQQKKIDLVVIGSEEPLALGLADDLHKAGIRVFGPSREAAQIETSKAFAKDFMQRHHIPTARYSTFKKISEALEHLHKISYPIVIKASGLAAGKGVFLPENLAEAETILRNLLQEQMLGKAGLEVVIEERLQGEEFSVLAFTDGVSLQVMPPARDHKRLHEGNLGPNTGGMGAFAPASLPASVSLESITQTILKPTIDGLRAENKSFVGVLYAGLMVTDKGPIVLEFNCRLGDPETQVLLPLLNTDLVEILIACTEQQLGNCQLSWKNASAVCVVLTAKGYPEKVQKGDVVLGIKNQKKNTALFPAGMQWQEKHWVTTGGRVLGVTAWDENLAAARKTAYDTLSAIHFPGMHYRKDIAQGTTDLYASAGVDITAGNRTVELMTDAVRSTYGPEVLAGIGAFGGMYNAAQLKTMDNPVLVASTDGIGTKVHLAAQANQYHSLGFDIVNHSINDILVQGAKPLFFLDYLASSKLDAEKMATIVTGMAQACRHVGCALLGGETAEMPDVYTPGSFDVAGTIVGIVEKNQALPRADLQPGDVLLGLASSGPHTNGYSLIRKIFQDVPLNTVFPELNAPLADVLLAPHRCYLPVLQPALQDQRQLIKALVHITGGGFYENIPRVLPQGVGAKINLDSWPVPPLFRLLQQRGQVPNEQMYRVFNMGIGMIIITQAQHVASVQSLIAEKVWVLGELIAGEKHVVLS